MENKIIVHNALRYLNRHAGGTFDTSGIYYKALIKRGVLQSLHLVREASWSDTWNIKDDLISGLKCVLFVIIGSLIIAGPIIFFLASTTTT